MILYSKDIKPSKEILDRLKLYQDEIDNLATFELRSERAKIDFPKRNRIGNKVFDEIKIKLTEMCSGARRCVYCEDSVADEVEHIQPKDLYPNFCFHWDNYVYACGNCNGPKNNKFAIFRKDSGKFEELNPPKGTKASKPPLGDNALINPRIEDPMDFCMLDLASTFKFVIIKIAGTKDAQKADYTFNRVLRLNDREFLRKARANAYTNYKSRLGYYVHEKFNGKKNDILEKLVENLRRESHQTVWKEMQRQHSIGILSKIDKDLDELFVKSPEALNW